MTAEKSQITELFDKTLPVDDGIHHLMVGDMHNMSEHIHLLHNELPNLVKNHKLTSISLELSIFANVLIWAYQDGTLEAKTGSKRAAKDYFIKEIDEFVSPSFRSRGLPFLLMDAIDHGVRVTCADSRHAIYRGIFKDHYKSILPAIGALVEQSPEYASRLEVLQNAAIEGKKRKIPSDALYAAMSDAMAPEKGNRITIIGAGHFTGHAIRKKSIHGTVAEHLELMHADDLHSYTISKAFIASTANIKEYLKIQNDINELHGQERVRGKPMLLVDLDTQKTTPATYPNEQKISLHRQMIVPWHMGSTASELEKIKIRANPLLCPAIKQRLDKIHEMMNGSAQTIYR